MKSNIKRISINRWDYPEWLAWRQQNGIGGSEVATVLGLNNPKYGSNLELHLSKAGLWDQVREDNFYTYKGRVTEDSIINKYWKLYTDSPESVLINVANDEYVKKKCSKINAFLVNDKYPWVFASLDRELPKGHISMLTGEILVDGGILEAKNTMAAEAAKYDSGISPAFLAQTQLYLAITEKKYAELQLLIDNVYPQLYAFERDESFIEGMLELTKKFWDNILSARELVNIRKQAELNGDNSALGQIDYELSKLEPEPQATEGYASFLKEKYRDIAPKQSMIGEQEQYEWAVELAKVKKEIIPLEEKQTLYENKLKKYMGEQNIEILDFEKLGKVNWKVDVNKVRKFTSTIKIPQ